MLETGLNDIASYPAARIALNCATVNYFAVFVLFCGYLKIVRPYPSYIYRHLNSNIRLDGFAVKLN